MSLLRKIETQIEQIVEGAFGKAFRSNVQPVELARRLVKEMDEHQSISVRKVYVPNVYDIYLSKDDHDQFASYENAMLNELSEYLAEHARRSGYSLLSRPRVALHVDDDLEVGAFGIAARMEGEADGESAVGSPSAGSTMIYRPSPEERAAEVAAGDFRLVSKGGRFDLTERRMTIGRGRMNDITINDSSVSREHAELVQDGGTYVVRDLDSTNGVLVNGARVREQVLAPGDTVTLGNSVLRFERAGDGAGA